MQTAAESNVISKAASSIAVAAEWTELESRINDSSAQGDFSATVRVLFEENAKRLTDIGYHLDEPFRGYQVIRWVFPCAS